MNKNPVNWLEIPTVDLERAKNFYAKVFNLEFQYAENPEAKMYMFGSSEAIGSGGGLSFTKDEKPCQTGTLVYFSCDDVTTALEKVKKQGGAILVDRTDIGEHGFFAHILDSEGNRIGVHSYQ